MEKENDNEAKISPLYPIENIIGFEGLLADFQPKLIAYRQVSNDPNKLYRAVLYYYLERIIANCSLGDLIDILGTYYNFQDEVFDNCIKFLRSLEEIIKDQGVEEALKQHLILTNTRVEYEYYFFIQFKRMIYYERYLLNKEKKKSNVWLTEVYSKYLAPYAVEPENECKKGLAYILKINIEEIVGAMRKKDFRIIHTPLIENEKLKKKDDNLMFHKESIIVFEYASRYFLLYQEAYLRMTQIIQKFNDKLFQICTFCLQPIIHFQDLYKKRSCGHLYHRRCASQKIDGETNKRVLLTKNEKRTVKVYCHDPSCAKIEFIEEELIDIFGKEKFLDYDNQRKTREKEDNDVKLTLRCCKAELSAQAFRESIFEKEFEGKILSFEEEKAKFISCYICKEVGKKESFTEKELKMLMGDDAFKKALKSTCCCCGAIIKLDHEEYQTLDCTHSICPKCLQERIITDLKALNGAIIPTFSCRICFLPKKLEILRLDAQDHSASTLYIMHSLYKEVNEKLVPPTIRCVQEGCKADAFPGIIKCICSWTMAKEIVHPSVGSITDGTLAQINAFITDEGALAKRILDEKGASRLFFFSLKHQEAIIEKKILDSTKHEEEEKIEFPKDWDHSHDDKGFVLITIPSGTEDFVRIQKRFNETMPGTIIKKIEKIQAMTLWRRYAVQKRILAKKNEGNPNERWLFHGSRACPPEQIYGGEEGFDMRFANKGGSRGGGIYFAHSASYSHGYKYSAPQGSQMFYACVLLGKIAPNVDPNCLMPPVLNGSVRYDSVQNGDDMFIVYANSKCYPSYLLTY